MTVNGQYSGWFDVKIGTRHGDPLSPYLFLICAEILSILVTQNKSIGGIKILDEEILLSQFADDRTFFLTAKEHRFMHVCEHYNSLLQCGLNMNLEKMVVVWTYSREHSDVKVMPELNLNWSLQHLKCWVWYFLPVHDIVLINYENNLKEMEKKNLLNAWSRRNITPFGKITVIKTLVISKITHLFMNLPDPDERFL